MIPYIWLMLSSAAVVFVIPWAVSAQEFQTLSSASNGGRQSHVLKETSPFSNQIAQTESDEPRPERQQWEAPPLGSQAYIERADYVRELMSEQERLARVSHKLAVNVVALCRGRMRYTTGAFLFDWDLTSDEWVDAAKDAIGINLHLPGIEVLIIVPGSPAERAGLRVGDRIVRLGAWPVPAGRGAFAEFHRRLNATLDQSRVPVELMIQRGTRFFTLAITPVPACDYPAILVDNEDINAFADGEKIGVNRGVVHFVKNDDELATVVAHEMAHNALGHIDETRQRALAGWFIGSMFDVLLAAGTGIHTNVGRIAGAQIGAIAFSKKQEAEADYVGIYMVALAGYDFTKSPGLEQRYALEEDDSTYSLTHPTSSKRVKAMDKAVKEIQQKISAQRPLYPENYKQAPPN